MLELAAEMSQIRLRAVAIPGTRLCLSTGRCQAPSTQQQQKASQAVGFILKRGS